MCSLKVRFVGCFWFVWSFGVGLVLGVCCWCGGLVDVFEFEVLDVMFQVFFVLFEFGYWMFLWVWYEVVVFGLVVVVWCCVYDVQYVFGIGFLVGGYVQYVVDFQFVLYQFGEFWLDDLLFVVVFFVLGIGEEQQQLIEVGVGYVVVQYFQCVVVIYLYVVQVLGQQVVEQCVDVWFVYFDVDEVDVRCSGGYFQGGMVYVEIDFESLWCLVIEDCVEVLDFIVQFQVEFWLVQVEVMLLVFGYVFGVYYEVFYGVYWLCFVVFCQGVLGWGLWGIVYGKRKFCQRQKGGLFVGCFLYLVDSLFQVVGIS